MGPMLTGYQFGTNNQYIGKYEFHNNLDKKEVHLPPNTVLVAPPENLADDKQAQWNGNRWVVIDRDIYVQHVDSHVEINTASPLVPIVGNDFVLPDAPVITSPEE